MCCCGWLFAYWCVSAVLHEFYKMFEFFFELQGEGEQATDGHCEIVTTIIFELKTKQSYLS